MTALPGFFDIVPYAEQEQWRSAYLWQYVEGIARHVARLYGCEEIRTPLLEREEVFARNVGEGSDIVAKEMYTFIDRGDRRLALRPEGTAAVMRAFIEHHFGQRGSLHKLFYISPMFRYERSQAGRYRQHHQFGVEAIGSPSPLQDAEIIDMLWSFFRLLDLSNLTLHLNCLGGDADRTSYREALVNYLTRYRTDLSADSQRRLDANPLRILDSKEKSDQEILEGAPELGDFLGTAESHHFEEVQTLLRSIGIPYNINQRLVRGLDYYNGTVFEITSSALGSQNSIGGGGRYDGMLKKMGGPDLPAFGFGTGLERVLQVIVAQGVTPPRPPGPLLYLIPLGEEALKRCFAILHSLREKGIPVQMDLGGRKLNKAMQQANSLKAYYTAVIGDDEIARGSVSLKHMSSGSLQQSSFEEIEGILQKAADHTLGVCSHE